MEASRSRILVRSFLIVVFVGLMLRMVVRQAAWAPSFQEPGTLGWDPGSGDLPFSWMGMIAFWSSLSLNMKDFTRFGRSQREQAIGRPRLPTT